ncbi:TIGR02206 family membrane protein [Actinopolyspora mortivallis]|uniref:YwaF family protein n=1 Tax=Actinopolyspora mortivallis TaxID=33906 RepID=UPI0005258E98|nr:TIGR02206 family membrane protein [Actinopolyspora mortivallis]
MGQAGTAETFTPYGVSHWVLLGVLAVGALLLVRAGRRHRGTRAGVLFTRAFALSLGLFAVAMQVYRVLPSQWNISVSLPLHLSDFTWIVAVYALWTHRQWAYSLTYYWGLTLNPQAMLTPALDAPSFPHIDFVDFWTQHTLVVWAAIYLTWGLGLRPVWRDFATTVMVTVVWGVAVFWFNRVTGTNYGFLNSKPNNPSLLDVMGPWPWYLAVEFVVGLTAWALITWPWTRSPGKPARWRRSTTS